MVNYCDKLCMRPEYHKKLFPIHIPSILHGVLVGLLHFGCLFIATGLKASGLWACLSFLGLV
jgi:hypothetical protein